MIREGWFDWAVREPGPASKQYTMPNKNEGIVFHSVEGSLQGAFSVLRNMARQASWTGTIAKNGTLYQHYPTFASVWTSGSREANTRFIAFESEGRAGEPLTSAQADTVLRIIDDCEDAFGWKAERQKTIWEHNECTRFGSQPTACPSNRYDAIWETLGDDMDEATVRAIVNAVLAEKGLDDIDDRLREVSIARERLRNLASDPDATRVENAIKFLREKGMNL